MFWLVDIYLTHWLHFLEEMHSELHQVVLESMTFYSQPILSARMCTNTHTAQ